MEAELYKLLGGYVGYAQTPLLIIQRQRLRIIATMNEQARQHKELQRKQEEQEREMKRMRSRGG